CSCEWLSLQSKGSRSCASSASACPSRRAGQDRQRHRRNLPRAPFLPETTKHCLQREHIGSWRPVNREGVTKTSEKFRTGVLSNPSELCIRSLSPRCARRDPFSGHQTRRVERPRSGVAAHLG